MNTITKHSGMQNTQTHIAAIDHDSTKAAVRSWDTVCKYGSTFPDGDGTGACDVEVQVGEVGGSWYLRTRDDAGGSDDCDATPYDSERGAKLAAQDHAEQCDECDGLRAKAWFRREADAAISAAKA